MRGLDLTSIYGAIGGSQGSNGSGGSGGSGSDNISTIDEYIANIDAYYEAEKRLQEHRGATQAYIFIQQQKIKTL